MAQSSYFPTQISSKQARDTGMAVVLVLLLIGFFSSTVLYYKIAIPVLIVNMTWPMAFYPIAVVWLGFSHALGTVMSKIILTIIYLVLVLPVGLFRRLIGKDPLLLRRFGDGEQSAMKTRNHTFTAEELEHPY